MEYQFSGTSFIIGLLILIAGALIVVFYRQIAENLASGVSSYDKVKTVGVLAVALGFLVLTNLHTFILQGFFDFILP